MEGRVAVSPPAFLFEQDFPPLPSDHGNHARAISIINQGPPQWVTSSQQSSDNIRVNLHRSVLPGLASSQPVSSHFPQHLSSRGRQQTPQVLQPLPSKHVSSLNQKSSGPQVDSQPAASSWTTISAHGSQTRGYGVINSRVPEFQKFQGSAFAQRASVPDAQQFPPLPPIPQRDANAPTYSYFPPPAAYFPSGTRNLQDSYAAVASSGTGAANSDRQSFEPSPNLRATAWSTLQSRQQAPAESLSRTSHRGRQVQVTSLPLRIVAYGERDPSRTPKRTDDEEDMIRKRGIRGRCGACLECRASKKRCNGEEICARCQSRGFPCVRNHPRPSARRRASSRNTMSPSTYSIQSGPTPSLMSLSSPIGPAEGAPISRTATQQIEEGGLDPKWTAPAHTGDDTVYAIGGGAGLAEQSTPHLFVIEEHLNARTNVPTSGEDFMQEAGQDRAPRPVHRPVEADIASEVDLADAEPPLFSHNFQMALNGEEGSRKTPVPVADTVTGSSTAVSHSRMTLSDVHLGWLGDRLDPLEYEDASTLFSSEGLDSYIKTDWQMS